jgi:hypothetical protein
MEERLMMPNVKKILAIAMLLVLFGFAIAIHTGTPAAAADRPQSVQKIDEQRLVGRWVRTDGGYVLELRDIKKDGKLQASYFNPRSINVSRAEWKRKEERIDLFVELRDVNYPGSNYTLHYDPTSDRLIGSYFQAVQRLTFDVEFARSK